ncbi:MAG: hypothetical protein K2N64_00480 [Anaeroplasmataceae bacterium]|nr:hypothetical protein [Anaeroplasmataceae bacterium]
MKRIIDTFLQMVYPTLISLFIFVFTAAFVKDNSLEPLQLISAVLSIVFGLIFLIGFVMNIIYSLKHKIE